MKFSWNKLGIKLAAISTLFLIVACIAIGITLSKSWDMEGTGAAINALGSERMRTYRISYLLAEQYQGVSADRLNQEVAEFEHVLKLIIQGDPERPMYLPNSKVIKDGMVEVQQDWETRIQPLIKRVRDAESEAQKKLLFAEYRSEIEPFVGKIDMLVSAVEHNSVLSLSVLRTLQTALLILALVGTLVMIGLLYLVVVRPIHTLRNGMLHMEGGNFSVRLPIESEDELGDLTMGFNNMADHLQQIYDTLEQRVREKTQILEEHRDELKTLYEVTGLLGKARNTEEMCREFLQQLMKKYGAAGGVVRLVDRIAGEMHMFVNEGLPLELVNSEQCKHMGECFCGEAVEQNNVAIRFVGTENTPGVVYNCHKAGYNTVLTLPVLLQGQSIGLCTLFFLEKHVLSLSERKLLETLVQHLGIAIESLRMVVAEKELAISAERNLLAQELHDSIAQSLAFLNLQVQMMSSSLEQNDMQGVQADLARIRAGVQESYDDVRELLVHFRTRVSHSDLETELARSISKLEAQSGISTSFVQSGTALPLHIEQQAQVLYIVQEALSNVRKHARATTVEIKVHRGDEYLFTIRDNGCGLDAAAIDHGRRGGIGMSIMRERAESIGSTLEIYSTPGNGTEIRLRVPVAPERVNA